MSVHKYGRFVPQMTVNEVSYTYEQYSALSWRQRQEFAKLVMLRAYESNDIARETHKRSYVSISMVADVLRVWEQTATNRK